MAGSSCLVDNRLGGTEWAGTIVRKGQEHYKPTVSLTFTHQH